MRGVAEDRHAKLLEDLDTLGLIDADPAVESMRNILMPPFWTKGDLSDRLYARLLQTLPTLPTLPQKMGFAIDTGTAPYLATGSADFRFERDEGGTLILRADGCALGRPVDEADAMTALNDMVTWFLETGGPTSGRMARHLVAHPVPQDWQHVRPRASNGAIDIGPVPSGSVLGVLFGRIAAKDLRRLAQEPGIRAFRPLLGRKLMVRGAQPENSHGFAAKPSRLMDVHACPGAPLCPQATVETTQLARDIADITNGTLHVSAFGTA